MSRKNHPPHNGKINIESFAVEYYSDPDHPEIYKIVNLDLKTVFVNVCGDYDGIVKLEQSR